MDMAEWLKRGADVGARETNDRNVRDAVEAILADIASRGDAGGP
jgi:sulfopropanediol 3-dehydrogenase